MSLNLVTLLYLVASVCFIQALKGLSHPTTSIRGNLFGMIGMAIAGLTTAVLIVKLSGQMGQGGANQILLAVDHPVSAADAARTRVSSADAARTCASTARPRRSAGTAHKPQGP